MIPTYVLTNNNHLWLLPGFAYLWNKYCDKDKQVVVACFDRQIELPSNFHFYSLGKQLPASKWSDGLLKMLDEIGHKYFILMLEDYWLYDEVNIPVINNLAGNMNDDILRIDISGNRYAYSHKKLNNGLVETFSNAPYQMSFQAAVWHKHNIKKVLKKDENPWQSEINGSGRVENLRVLGTKAMSYQPVWRSKKRKLQVDKLNQEDLEYIKAQGWLNK